MKFAIFFTIVLYLCFSQVFANEKLNLAILDLPPYEYRENGKIDGVTVRVVREIFNKMNQPIKIKLLPWSRALFYLKKGKIDGLFEILKCPEREKYTDYSRVVLMPETASLFVREDSNIKFDGDLSKLKKYRFGVRKDFSYGEKFDNISKKTILTNVDPLKLMTGLIHGRMDILIGDKHVIPYLYNKEKSTFKSSMKIKRLSPDVQDNPSYMAFSKKRNLKKTRDLFDKTLKKMKKNGSYAKIIEDFKAEKSQDSE